MQRESQLIVAMHRPEIHEQQYLDGEHNHARFGSGRIARKPLRSAKLGVEKVPNRRRATIGNRVEETFAPVECHVKAHGKLQTSGLDDRQAEKHGD